MTVSPAYFLRVRIVLLQNVAVTPLQDHIMHSRMTYWTQCTFKISKSTLWHLHNYTWAIYVYIMVGIHVKHRLMTRCGENFCTQKIPVSLCICKRQMMAEQSKRRAASMSVAFISPLLSNVKNVKISRQQLTIICVLRDSRCLPVVSYLIIHLILHFWPSAAATDIGRGAPFI